MVTPPHAVRLNGQAFPSPCRPFSTRIPGPTPASSEYSADLAQLRLGEVLLGERTPLVEQGAAVGERLVEERHEQLVAQVVMGPNVLRARADGVSLVGRDPPVHQPAAAAAGPAGNAVLSRSRKAQGRCQVGPAATRQSPAMYASPIPILGGCRQPAGTVLPGRSTRGLEASGWTARLRVLRADRVRAAGPARAPGAGRRQDRPARCRSGTETAGSGGCSLGADARRLIGQPPSGGVGGVGGQRRAGDAATARCRGCGSGR